MRILFTSHSSGVAGAEQSLVHLVKEATARGHTGTVALPADGPLADRLNTFCDSFEITILRSRLWMGRRYTLPVGLVRLVQAVCDVPGYLHLIKKHRYDAVVVNSAVAPVPLLAALLSGVPSLLIVRESLLTNPMLKSVIPKRIIRRLLSIWATDVITISKYVAEQFKFASTTIYPQVSKDFLEFRADRRAASSGQTLKAVMFGTISPEKGQLDAVRAVRLARDRGTPVSLELYGNGRDSDLIALHSEITQLGLQQSVVVRNTTSDVLQVYQSADVSIVCSRNEAFGKVTAESVLAGRPVVAYGCGGTSEILAHGGGICTEPNPASLSDVLISLYENGELVSTLRQKAAQSPLRGILTASAAEVVKRIEAFGRA